MSLVHKDRISELDSLKALALVMMLISNFVSDLSFFKIMEVTKGDPWWYLARATASLFVCISGFSYYLANRESPNFTRVFLRTKKLIFWAFIITIVTYLFQPDAYIRFGVLHLLALASLVAFPFVKKPIIGFLFGLLLFFVQLANFTIPLTNFEIGGLLSTKVLSMTDWGIIIAVAFTVLVIEEFRKFIVNSKLFAIKSN